MSSLELPCSQHTLANGLDVLIHEDHHVPIVAVNIWYRVGSRNEHPGRTGFAHLFEHLMFEGSAHHDASFFRPIEQAGGVVNGSTSTDRTNYWEMVPSGALELTLWLESDRMGHLLPALTAERFETQRGVVLNERRQNYENRPYGLASIALAAMLYPESHPYAWPTIGAADDIRAMQLEDVQDFFKTYYCPANASLAIAGDVDTAHALGLAERYFGDLPAGRRAAPVATPQFTHAAQHGRLDDQVELPRLYLAWHSPAMFTLGDAELDLVADLLANGKSARLYRTLVYERRMALDVAAAQASRELGSYFLIVATAAPGVSLDQLHAVIDDELEQFRVEGPSADEMARGTARAEAGFLSRLQSVGGFGGKSDQLNAYNVMLGRPEYFSEDLERYRRATPEALREYAATTLTASSRVALGIVPTGRDDLALRESRPIEVA